MDKSKSQSSPPRMVALSSGNAHLLIVRAWHAGLAHVTDHCRRRMRERAFDMADVESVIREGGISGMPEYCEVLGNWKYNVSASIEDSSLRMRTLRIIVGIDASYDHAHPIIALITGYWED